MSYHPKHIKFFGGLRDRTAFLHDILFTDYENTEELIGQVVFAESDDKVFPCWILEEMDSSFGEYEEHIDPELKALYFKKIHIEK